MTGENLHGDQPTTGTDAPANPPSGGSTAGGSAAEIVGRMIRILEKLERLTDAVEAWIRRRKEIPEMLTRSALLWWLSQEESSAYGECHGPLLDELVARGLVEISPQIAGRDDGYRRVRLTDAGRETVAKNSDQEPFGARV